jgi:basic amino acid/polyamine antiporter, APA family
VSRVMLAMARRKDLPAFLAKVNPDNLSPANSVLVTGLLIALLVLTGDVTLTWSFSAFTVLIYYAITNLSALLLPASKRLFPVWIPFSGLSGCVFLAFWIEPAIWISGLALLFTGICWHFFALNRLKQSGR